MPMTRALSHTFFDCPTSAPFALGSAAVADAVVERLSVLYDVAAARRSKLFANVLRRIERAGEHVSEHVATCTKRFNKHLKSLSAAVEAHRADVAEEVEFVATEEVVASAASALTAAESWRALCRAEGRGARRSRVHVCVVHVARSVP